MSDIGVPHVHAEVEDNSFWLAILGLFVIAIFCGVFLRNQEEDRKNAGIFHRLDEVEVTLADLSHLRSANAGSVRAESLTRASYGGSDRGAEVGGDPLASSSPVVA